MGFKDDLEVLIAERAQQYRAFEADPTVQRLRERIAVADDMVRDALAKCPHERTQYWPDPSGNNDSGYTCLDCGKDL